MTVRNTSSASDDCDDDVAGHRERVGDEPDQVEHENEHEEREHERKEFHPLGAGGAAQCCGDELVGHFCDRLQAARHQGARAGGAEHQQQRSLPAPSNMNNAELVSANSHAADPPEVGNSS